MAIVTASELNQKKRSIPRSLRCQSLSLRRRGSSFVSPNGNAPGSAAMVGIWWHDTASTEDWNKMEQILWVTVKTQNISHNQSIINP